MRDCSDKLAKAGHSRLYRRLADTMYGGFRRAVPTPSTLTNSVNLVAAVAICAIGCASKAFFCCFLLSCPSPNECWCSSIAAAARERPREGAKTKITPRQIQLCRFASRHASAIGVFLVACDLKVPFLSADRQGLCRIKVVRIKNGTESRTHVQTSPAPCVLPLRCNFPSTNSCLGKGRTIMVHLGHSVHASNRECCFC